MAGDVSDAGAGNQKPKGESLYNSIMSKKTGGDTKVAQVDPKDGKKTNNTTNPLDGDVGPPANNDEAAKRAAAEKLAQQEAARKLEEARKKAAGQGGDGDKGAGDPDKAATDKLLEGVIDPATRAQVVDLSKKVVDNIEKGADALGNGDGKGAMKAYDDASALITPADQKKFLDLQLKVKEQIRLEQAKTEGQDAKKLEAMKQLERQLRTLAYAPIFTQANAALVAVQTGDLNQAKEYYKKANANEQEMIKAGLLKEPWLAKEPNFGKRVKEISEKYSTDSGKPLNIWDEFNKAIGTTQPENIPPKDDKGEVKPPPGAQADKDLEARKTLAKNLIEAKTPDDQKKAMDAIAQNLSGKADQVAAAKVIGDELKAKGFSMEMKDGTDKSKTVLTFKKDSTELGTREISKPAPTTQPEVKDVKDKTVKEVVLSPAVGGKSPVDRVLAEIDKAYAADPNWQKENRSLKLSPDTKKAIEQAIADADGPQDKNAISPTLGKLKQDRDAAEEKVGQGLDSKIPGSNETVRQAIRRIGQAAQEKVQKLEPPKDFKGSKDDYHDQVLQLWSALDDCSSDKAYKQTLGNLKKLIPDSADGKAVTALLDERDKATEKVRPDLYTFNGLTARVSMEANQSAQARALYAELLTNATDPDAPNWAKGAYAWNQDPDQTLGLRQMALNAGVEPIDLVKAAIDQNKARGGGANGHCLEVENILGDSFSMYNGLGDYDKTGDAQKDAAAKKKAQENQATFAKQLEEPFKQLQDMADTEFAQLQGKTKTLSAAYEAAMPSDAGQKKEMIDCQKTMRTAEAKFSKEDLQNAGILGDPTSAEGDRNAARAALQKSQPDWLKAADRWKELAGDKLPALLKAQGDIIQHTQNVNQALDNQFYSRYLMARMMLETGNKDGAKAQALAAFGAVPKSSREILWNREGDPKQDGSKTYPIREIATQAGITKADIDKLPEPTLKVVAPANDGKGDKGDKADGKGDKQDDKPDTSGLNPRFAKMEIAELDKFAHEKAQSLETLADAKDAFEELVKRYDLMLNDKEIEKSLAAQKLFLEALQKGKAAVPESKDEKTGQIIPAHVGDQPLTEEQRWNYHLTMYSDMETMAKQVQYRQELAELLKAAKQPGDDTYGGGPSKGGGADKDPNGAAYWSNQACEKAARLMQTYNVNGQQVKPMDLLKAEKARLIEDTGANISDPNRKKALQELSTNIAGADMDSGFMKQPINTERFRAQLYLRTEVVWSKDGKTQEGIKFGVSPGFTPVKAKEAADKAREYTKQILGFDPMDQDQAKQNPGVAALYGGILDVVDHPEKYNLYDVVDAHSIENIKKEIHKDSGVTSLLIDLGIVVTAAGIIAASRNPKVAATMEKILGKIPGVELEGKLGKILPVAGYSTVLIGGVPARHYAYHLATGADESWGQSTAHFVGSLAAAELGSRVMGRGSLLGGEALGPRQFAAFRDPKVTAEYLSRGANGQTYETVGKFQDLLETEGKRLMATSAEGHGYIELSKKFAGLSRDMKLVDAVEQLEKAGADLSFMKGAQVGTLAKFMKADAALLAERGAPGLKQDELVKALGEGTTLSSGKPIKTLGELKEVFSNNQALHTLAEKLGVGVDNSTGLKDAVQKLVTDGGMDAGEAQKLLDSANALGLGPKSTVGNLRSAVQKAASTSAEDLFQKIEQMKKAGYKAPDGKPISDATSLSDLSKMSNHIFEGDGLKAVIELVPPDKRIGLFVRPETIEKFMAKPPQSMTLSKRVVENLKAGGRTLVNRDTWNSVGRTAKTVVNPLKWDYAGAWEGTRAGARWTGGKLSNMWERTLSPAKLDPLKAPPESLVRARFASGLQGMMAGTFTYNSIAKTADLTDQTDPRTGQNYSLGAALIEANFPTVAGTENLPYGLKYVASTLVGSPGQALWGTVLFGGRPGMLSRAGYEGRDMGMIRRSWAAVSPERWSGAFAPAGSFASMTLPSMQDQLDGQLKVGKYKDMLRRTQQGSRNEPLPPQKREDLGGDDPKPSPKPKKEGDDDTGPPG